ncbi:MAG: BON domain-containing protein [Bacteroidetes bacterium]|jgi:osmotically-inducible protein OsmY|nr:BON domain-containing protein [Bacteroidota bacterium]
MKTDAQIQQDVIEELKWQPFIHASEIGVAVKNGIVTLTGTVDTYAKKLAAELAAKKIAGVKAVAEDIEVKLPGSLRKTDAEIAEAVLNALKWHSAVQEEKIKIKVEKGWVSLQGEAEWEFQKAAARDAIENLSSVIGVTDNIIITPRVTATDIKAKIILALQRSANLDAERIKIETIGNKVILTGKVRSLAEKKDAAKAAWMAPGVKVIENNLEIASEIYAL